MPPKIKRIVIGVISFLVLTNLLTLALLWRDYREKFPAKSKPTEHLKVVAERVPNTAATPEFTFIKVPSPSKSNAATLAHFSVVSGFPERLYNLQAPYLPSGPDSPSENFFFADGTYGGRFMIDLNQVMGIRQINTYSWHTGARGPQVYRLYATDSLTNAEPIGAKDPLTLGWKFLADVDTRPSSGEPGGQYGVSITSPEGLIGRYRYLMFDCKRTEDADRWGNTFYSKVNVIAE